jgi:hypothetical protein
MPGHVGQRLLGDPEQGDLVDVAGQALALGQPTALPLGRGQLAAGRLQLLDQLPALVALVDDAGEPEREQGAEHHREQAASSAVSPTSSQRWPAVAGSSRARVRPSRP